MPWQARAVPDADAECLVLVSSLPLRSLGATFRFFRDVRTIRGQLARADGLIGYSLSAKPFAKRYWTLSVWRDEAALAAFIRASPHAEVMTSLQPDMDATKFVRWTVRGSETPVSWADALRRLDADAGRPPA